ncbi:MAG: protein jag [Clostridia bacterium]|nr:protein jag [Clostridia bacterium]
MKREIEVTAKTVEEAYELAAAQLGVAKEAIEFTVLEEAKRGFLGIGACDAKVKATYTLSGADLALEFIQTVIADMGLNTLTVQMKKGEGEDVTVTVDGEGAGLLIGHHGETLDSLQYLANLAANKKVKGEKREYVKVTLDVEGYRAKREEALRALARRMAAKVVKAKKSVMLEPMNPYERRIIHSEVQGIAGVSTNSIGSENNRRIVMFLDDEKVGGTSDFDSAED